MPTKIVPKSSRSTKSLTDTLPDFGGDHVLKRAKSGMSDWLRGLIVVIVIALIAGLAGYGYSTGALALKGVKKTQQFQAVFLNNGQVYFGTIVREDRENVVLDNVFYLQTFNREVAGQDGTPTSTVQETQLVKKGEEVYGPENTIRINRSQVVTIEALKEDSTIMQQMRARM